MTLMVRFANFRTVNRSHTYTRPVSSKKPLHQGVLRMLLPFFDTRENAAHLPLRLVGVRLEKLI